MKEQIKTATVERLPALLLPGWDCRGDNANCRSCNWLTEHGKSRDDHGIHGDGYVFGVRTELPDGRMAAITLEIFTGRYPKTANYRPTPHDRYPYGASLDLHLQVAAGAPGHYDFMPVHETCEWLGPGRRCDSDGSGLCAQDVYKNYGIQDDRPGVDLTKQPDALYVELERFLWLWTEGK
jgi:hypothetical protein